MLLSISARTFVVHALLLKHLAILLDLFVVVLLVFGLSGALDEFYEGLFLLINRNMFFFFLVIYINCNKLIKVRKSVLYDH